MPSVRLSRDQLLAVAKRFTAEMAQPAFFTRYCERLRELIPVVRDQT